MKIAAFNVKRMGWTKVYKKAVWKRISKIVSEYSVVVLLEVMDETGKAMKRLLKRLNDYGDDTSNPYGMECSESLRPEGHKEKFVYFYSLTMLFGMKGVYRSRPLAKHSHNFRIFKRATSLCFIGLDLSESIKMKIAAFNVQRLGWDKINKEGVEDIIIKIVSQYSVVVLLEVTDVDGEAMPLLRKHLNDYGDNRSNPYGMRCSESLGRTTYKEKFVYFYRKKEVQIIDSYQYVENNEDNEYDEDDDEDDDEDNEDDDEDDEEEDVDKLAREPFAVLLKCPNTVVQELVLIPVHIKTSDAAVELNALHEVVKKVKKKWKNDNIMILGDFNADVPYLSKKKKEKEALRISSAPYHWLIGDEVNTMTRNNNHAYDRIVVYGERMLEAIVPKSAKAYNFKQEFNLTEEQALSVSDHYPVEVELKVKPEVKTEVELMVKLMVEQLGKLELMVKLMVEQMGKLELMVEQRAQRKRNPE